MESFVSLAVSALTLFSSNSQRAGVFGVEHSAELGNLKRQADRLRSSATGDGKIIKGSRMHGVSLIMHRRVKLSAILMNSGWKILINGCLLKWMCWSFNDLILPTLRHGENFHLMKDGTELFVSTYRVESDLWHCKVDHFVEIFEDGVHAVIHWKIILNNFFNPSGFFNFFVLLSSPKMHSRWEFLARTGRVAGMAQWLARTISATSTICALGKTPNMRTRLAASTCLGKRTLTFAAFSSKSHKRSK